MVESVEDRRAALIASCANDEIACAVLLLDSIPVGLMDQPLNICVSKGQLPMVQAILDHYRSCLNKDPGVSRALNHARNIAKAKGKSEILGVLEECAWS